MNLVRKITIGLVGCSLAILLTVLLLNPQSIYQLALNLIDTSALIRLPVAILIDALILVIVAVFIRTDRASRTPASGLMVKAQGAIADVSVESARERILRAVRAVPDVLSAETEIKAIHGKADIELDVAVSRESINLPEKQREIDRALRQVASKQLGLQLAGKPRVHIRMSDESSIPSEPAPPLPSVIQEAAEPEAAAPPSEEPLRLGSLDAMSLRPGEADSSEPSTPA